MNAEMGSGWGSLKHIADQEVDEGEGLAHMLSL
jgi:hypothetical protein